MVLPFSGSPNGYLLLIQTVCFDRWKTVLPLGHYLAASWQGDAGAG